MGVCCDILWQFNVGNLEIILCIVGSMGAYKQSMDGVVLVRWPARDLSFYSIIRGEQNLTPSYQETIV